MDKKSIYKKLMEGELNKPLNEKKNPKREKVKKDFKTSLKFAKGVIRKIDTFMKSDDWGVVDGFVTNKQTGLASIVKDMEKSMNQIIKMPIDESANEPTVPFSSPEAKVQVDKDLNVMSKHLGKASQQVIKTMMSGVKSGKYDAMDLARGIQQGNIKVTHYGERDFIQQLWNKVRDGFRRYSKRGKLR